MFLFRKPLTKLRRQYNTKHTRYVSAMESLPYEPASTRTFPMNLEFLLPLRSSCRMYKEAGGVISTNNDIPEVDMSYTSSDQMYGMCAMSSIIGHGCSMQTSEEDEGKIPVVCEREYKHTKIDRMGRYLEKWKEETCKWVFNMEDDVVEPIVAPNKYLRKAASVYTEFGPLMVYTNLATLEARLHSSDSAFWKTIYAPMEPISCAYNTAGLIECNSLVSLEMFTGNDESCTPDQRKCKTYHRGFVDSYYTPQSKSAGRIRTLVAGVGVRIMTTRTLEMASEILKAVVNPIAVVGDWIVRCMGYTATVTEEDVSAMVSVWSRFCDIEMPTLHIFKTRKVVTISVSSGVLMRPVRLLMKDKSFSFEGPFVDTMCVYHSDTMKYINKKFPSWKTEPSQMASANVMMIPFYRYDTEPRTGLGVGMMKQSLCELPTKGEATMRSVGRSEPVLKTQFAAILDNSSSEECPMVIPGRNMVMAFINMQQNTEDACIVNKTFAEMGWFTWSGYIDYPLPKDCGKVEAWDVLFDQSWWKPSIPGLVLKTYVNKHGGMNAYVFVGNTKLEVGDKLATWHGLKFTVGCLMEYNEIPELEDTVSGERFRPNIMVSTKNLNRGIGGQVREMTAYTRCFDNISSFRSCRKNNDKEYIDHDEEHEYEARLPEAYVLVNGHRISFVDTGGKMRTVKCNYGVSRVLHLRHKPSLKQHYPSDEVHSREVTRGRYKGGTPRVSETEILSMMMQGLYRCSKECLWSSDLVNVTVCSKCWVLTIYCDCSLPKPTETTVSVRYSAVKMCVYATTAMLNDGVEKPMTLKFLTECTD